MPAAPSGAMGRFAALLVAIALTVAGTTALSVLTAAPAAAHTQLVDSSPAAGEVLAGAPTEVILEFGGKLLEFGAIILVVDEAGADWTSGELVIERSTARIALRPDLPDGRYEVRWQVVAEDGHPISDVFRFGVGAAGAEPAPPATDPLGQAGGANPPEETAGAVPAPPGIQESAAEALRIALVGLGGAALGILVALLIRRRRSRDAGAAAIKGEQHSPTTPTHS